MWSALGSTKRDIMLINATKPRPKIRKDQGKCFKIEYSSAKSDAEVKSVREFRICYQIRYSKIEDHRPDPFTRYWILLTNLGQFRIQFGNE